MAESDEVRHVTAELLKSIVKAQIVYQDRYGRAILIRDIEPVRPGMVVHHQVPTPEDVITD